MKILALPYLLIPLILVSCAHVESRIVESKFTSYAAPNCQDRKFKVVLGNAHFLDRDKGVLMEEALFESLADAGVKAIPGGTNAIMSGEAKDFTHDGFKKRRAELGLEAILLVERKISSNPHKIIIEAKLLDFKQLSTKCGWQARYVGISPERPANDLTDGHYKIIAGKLVGRLTKDGLI